MERKLLARVGRQPWLHRYPRGAPILLFVLIVATTILSMAAIERAQNESHQLELDRNATEAAAALQRRAAQSTAILIAAAAYFESRNAVTPTDFSAFAARIHTGYDRHGSMGLGWAPLIPAREGPQFELLMRQNVDPDYQLRPWPSPDQGWTAPIMYLVPQSTDNRRAIGYDMYSESVRREAIDRALRLHAPTASGIVRLAQNAESDRTAGFLIYMPVYRTEGARRYVQGLVYMPFRGSQFLSAASSLYANRPFETAIYDQVVDPDHLIAQQPLPGRNDLSMDRRLQIGGRTWILRINMKQPSVLTPFSLTVLAFGLLLGMTVATIARIMIRQAEEDRAVLEILTQQAAIRDSLTRELNHRVKNTLANVLSILALTKRGATDVESFAQGLGDRIRALSATHDLLSQSGWTDASVGDIVRSELAPYMTADTERVRVNGPEIRLSPRESMSLGLALHELATNAAKYGAFSRPEGKVTVEWRLSAPEMAEVDWQERDGPPVEETERRGFGRDLIEKIVAQELQSDVDLRFRPEGVECRLHVPVRKLTPFTLRAGGARDDPPGRTPS